MVTLTGEHRELYDVLQEKVKANLTRVSGSELGELPENETLARDILNLPADTVIELLKKHNGPGIAW
jgi:hypothetical protein